MPEQLTYRNYWDYRTGDATYRGVVLQVDKAAAENADVEVHSEYLPNYYAPVTETWDYASMFDGTTIFRNGVEEVTVDEGTMGSFVASAGDVFTASRPVGMMAPGFARSVTSDVHRGRKFGVYTSRYQPHSFHVYAVEAATVTYEHVAGANPRQSATEIASQAISAGGTYTFTSTDEGSHYFTATGDVVIMSKPSGGDGATLFPASREALHWRSYSAMEYEGNGALNVTFATGYTGAAFLEASAATPLFSGNSIADGAGGDTDPFVPINNTAPGYLIPHAVADFVLVSIEACTITAEHWNGAGWTVYGAYDMTTSSRGTPHAVSVGATSGADAQLAGGPWRFTSDNGRPFYMRLNDPTTDDEYSPHGFWLSGRDQLTVPDVYGAESIEAQSDEAFSFGTVAVADDDTAPVAVTEATATLSLLVDDDTAAVGLTEARDFATVAVADDDTADVQLGGDDATFVYVTASDSAGAGVTEAFDLFATLSSDETLQSQVTDDATLFVTFATSTDTAATGVTEARDFATVAVTGTDTPSVSAQDVYTLLHVDFSASDTPTADTSVTTDFATVAVVGADDATVDTAEGYEEVILAAVPFAYWRMGDGGSTAVDSSPGADGSKDGTHQSGVTTGAAGITADNDRAVSYLGTTPATAITYLPGAASVARHDAEWTWEAWVRRPDTIEDDPDANPVIAMESSASTNYWSWLYSGTSGALRLYSDNRANGGSIQSGVNFVLPLGEWKHLVYTYDPVTTASKWYVDGELETLQYIVWEDHGGLLAEGSIGAAKRGASHSNDFGGIVDEFAKYTRALTDDEVLAHYNAGRSGARVNSFLAFTDTAAVAGTENSVVDGFISVQDSPVPAVTESNATRADSTAFDNNLGVAVGDITGDEFVTFSASDTTSAAVTEARDFATVDVVGVDDADTVLTEAADNEIVFITSSDTAGVGATDASISPMEVRLARSDTAAAGVDDVYTLFVTPNTSTDSTSVAVADIVDSLGILQFMYVSDTAGAGVDDSSAILVTPSASDTTAAAVEEARDFATVDVVGAESLGVTAAETSDNEQVFLVFSDTAASVVQEAFALAITHYLSASDTLFVDVGQEDQSTFVERYAFDGATVGMTETFDFATVEVTDDDNTDWVLEEAFEFSTVIVTDDDTLTVTAQDAYTYLLAAFAAADAADITISSSFLFSTVIVADSDLVASRMGAEQTAVTVIWQVDDAFIMEVTDDTGLLLAMFARTDETTAGADEAFELTAYVTDDDVLQADVYTLVQELFRRTYGIVEAATFTLDGEGRTPKGGRAATYFPRKALPVRDRAATTFDTKKTNRGVPRGDGPRDG